MADSEARKDPPKPPSPSRDEEAREVVVQEYIDYLRALIVKLRKAMN